MPGFQLKRATLAGAVIGSGKWFNERESQLKKHYQIHKQGAAVRFRKQAQESNGEVQLSFLLPELIALVERGLMNLATTTAQKVIEGMMNWEVDQMVGPRNQADGERQNQRWGSQQGFIIIGGQKVPVERPRVRDVREKEVVLGSYEMLQQASLMEDAVWNKIMHGVSTRGYEEVVRELEQAYGVKKSTVSDHFIRGSRQRLEKLMQRPLDKYAVCAMMIDGTYYKDQDVVVAIGLTIQGNKVVLGLHQGATENATVVKHLLSGIQQRGLDFDVPRLYVLDGAKALESAVRKMAGKCALIQRCQVHKIRNVAGHLTEEFQMSVRCKMRNAYGMTDKAAAEKALKALLHELMHLNPSAAASLEEGMAETLTVHQLRMPAKLRQNLANTNLIESTFSTVETACRNVKRWQGGDQYLRWVASGLLWAESRWNRIRGYREIPILVKEMELAIVRGIPVKQSSVA